VYYYCNILGAGGVAFDSGGIKSIEFSWGLGHTSNNHVEALAVYMGLRLLPVNTSSKLVVIGDSDLIIKGLRRLIKNAHPTLARILLRIKDLEKKI
jgi:ribonuclease HI